MTSTVVTGVDSHTKTSARQKWLCVGLVLLCGLVVISPLLQTGYFWGAHDARHDVYFIQQYGLSFKEGILWPRWSPDWAFGYGYPFFTIYAPLSTFVGVLFNQLLGLGYEASVKAVLALSVLGSGLAMYGFARSWLGRHAGLVAAVAYMVVPYHLVNLFVRAALAESVALAFLPLALWGFREAVVRPRLRSVVFAGIAFAAVMWTSNLVALVFTPGLAAYVVALILLEARDRRDVTAQRRSLIRSLWAGEILRTAVAPAFGLTLGLGLSAAFFIPALVEQGYINKTQWFGAYYNPEQHFVYFNQLFDARWGFGISQPGPDDAAQGSLSYQLGAAATLFTIIALALSSRFRPRLRDELRFWGLWLAVAVVLTLPASVLLWRYVPIVGFAQFPWRYLMLAILPLSILPAALCPALETLSKHEASQTRSSHGALPAIILSILLLVSSAPYIKVEIRDPTPEQGPVSMSALMRFQRTSDEMTGVTAWVDPARRPMWSDMAELWVQGKPVTTRVDYGQVPQNDTLAINSEDVGTEHEQVYYHARGAGQSITFNRFWYPGWTAWLLGGKNGKPVRKLDLQRENGPLARIDVPIPQGDGYILLRFEDTPLRRASKLITLAVILGLLGVLVVDVGLPWRNSRRVR